MIVSIALPAHYIRTLSTQPTMKTKRYTTRSRIIIGTVFAISLSGTEPLQAQQLPSLVKTETFYNHMYRKMGVGVSPIATPITTSEQMYTYTDKNLVKEISVWMTTREGRYLSGVTSYTYREDGQTLTVISQQRDYKSKELHIQGITAYEYNVDGKIASMNYQYRDYNSGEMINSYKYEYTYGPGENQEFKIYNWGVEDGDWVEQPPYDEDEGIYTDEALYDGDLGYYHPESKNDLVYNEDSTLSTMTYQSYHSPSDTWYNTARSESQLNALGFTVKQVNSNWLVPCQEWTLSYMSTYKYNENNVAVKNEHFTWDPIGEEWVLNSRTESTYIDPKPIAEPAEKPANWGLFPNPSDGELFIELDEAKTMKVQIKVMSKLGQTVFADRISANETEHALDLQFLPNGNYIIYLDDGESKSSQQVVIQK